ncbi:MAG: leucine-rich repeat domain-containing protein [Prevotellaceae bacterium]|nr:leucine-rich repeat domain-containing protein [Prevotellaceae bacterium]
MANLAENINRAISDFDNIKMAIENKGVDVGNAPTSEYADKISQIESGGGAEILFSSDGRCYLKNLIIPEGVTNIGLGAYERCSALISVHISDSVTIIRDNAFYNCRSLEDVYIPSSITSIASGAFSVCTGMKNVVLGQGFNASIGLSGGKYTVEVMVAMMTALADLTGETAKTLTLGATNLAKLTAEQKRIATDKNWNLA